MTIPPIQLSADNTAPAVAAFPIVKSDTVNFTQGPCRAIRIGGAGDVNVVFIDDTTCIFPACLAGETIAVNAKRVNSASTTATLMVAMY
jgi:hypothetical protein